MGKKIQTDPKVSPEDAELFQAAVAKVRPLDQEPRVTSPRQKLKQRTLPADQIVPQGILREEGELFYRSSLSPGVLKDLRRGHPRPFATIDLHGHTVSEAEENLHNFLRANADFNPQCLLVITGKGSHSPDGQSPVRLAALDLLQTLSAVQAYCWARPEDGGTGAFYVLTQKLRS